MGKRRANGRGKGIGMSLRTEVLHPTFERLMCTGLRVLGAQNPWDPRLYRFSGAHRCLA